MFILNKQGLFKSRCSGLSTSLARLVDNLVDIIEQDFQINRLLIDLDIMECFNIFVFVIFGVKLMLPALDLGIGSDRFGY